VDALRKEAELLVRMAPHKNIVGMIGVCGDPENFALLLEYVGGGDLYRMLRTGDFTEWGGRLDAAIQIATGMDYLHSLQPPIVHMDLKPSNVLVEREKSSRVYKISDFGLSKTRGISSRTTRSSLNFIPSGTVEYIAPERFTTRLDLAKDTEAAMKVDVYRLVYVYDIPKNIAIPLLGSMITRSFGIMLWELKERQLYKPGQCIQWMCAY
jgi:serine/threonine protein kinase